MAGVWIETSLPTFSRLAGRRGVRRWALVLAGVFLAVGAAAMASRWRVTAYWTAPFWQERLGPGADLSLPPYERSVWPHAVAMTAVVALTLAIMVPLLRSGLFTVAVLVGAGAGFGPLRLLAAPVIGDLEFLESDPTPAQVGGESRPIPGRQCPSPLKWQRTSGRCQTRPESAQLAAEGSAVRGSIDP